MTNLDSVLKSKDITLPTKAHIVKAMVFTVVVYGCAAKSRQSCPTLCDPIDGSPPGFPGGSVGRSTGKGKGNPLRYSCLENYMYRGA